MGKPSVSRQNINTAPIPGVTNPLSDLLTGFLQSGQNPFANATQPSALQQQTGNSWGQVLGNLGSLGGQGVIDAAQPVFQRNLQLGADTLRQAGPRFNSNTERLIGQQGAQAMQDFNLFSQQAIQAGQQNQLAALNGAGGFSNTMQGQQLNNNTAIIQALLGLSGQAGLGPAALVQHPGGFANVMKVLGTGVGIASTLGGMFGGGGSKDPLASEGALTGNPGNYAPGTGPGATQGPGSVGPGGALDPVAPQPSGFQQLNLRNRFP